MSVPIPRSVRPTRPGQNRFRPDGSRRPKRQRCGERHFLLRGWRRFWARRVMFLAALLLLLWGMTRAVAALVGSLRAAPSPTSNAASLGAARGDARIAAEPEAKRELLADVAVIGATPSGIAAALGAARAGARVVMVEPRSQVGGDITGAFLNMFDLPIPDEGPAHSPMAYGVFGEMLAELGVAFDIERARLLFERHLREAGVQVRLDSHLAGAEIRRGRLSALRLRDGEGELRLRAPVWIDASNDADGAALAGASFSLGRQMANPDSAMQAAGLLWSVQGVDWPALRRYVRGRRALPLRDLLEWKHGAANAIDVRVQGRSALLRLGGIVDDYAWERGDAIASYRPRNPRMVALSVNFGRQADGSVVLNTLNITGVNGLDAAQRERAHREGSAEIPHLTAHLRRTLPGFTNARIARIAPELYIRETRHLAGLATLRVEDVRGSNAPWDRVALCSYPLDLHPYHPGDHNPFGPRRYLYAMPLRALVPRGIDGVFVASRSLSATYSAAGSARVIPITMAAGQAAGVAAAHAALTGLSPHQLIERPDQVEAVQNALRDAGFDVGDALAKAKAPRD